MQPVYRDKDNLYIPFELSKKLLADPIRAMSLIAFNLAEYGTDRPIRAIAKDSGISKSTVFRCLQRLKEWGFSVVEGTAPGFEKPT